MRRLTVPLAALLLMLASGVARAEDKPASEPSSVPGYDPGAPGTTEPARSGVDVERITLSVGGREVKEAPPGVEVTLTIRLHNFGDETARNVRARLEAPEGARLTDADASYGDIESQAGADGTFGIVINREGCPDFVGIAGEIAREGGTSPLKVAIAVDCPGPRLSLETVTFEGGDGDGVAEPGETLRAYVVLRNDGRDAATDVKARVKVTGRGVSSTTEEISWPDIAPGTSKRSPTAVAVTIADDAPRQAQCPPSPGGGPRVIEIPPEEGGTISSDTPVSSDGTVGSAPGGDGNSSSAPGSTGAGASGSSGGGSEPTVVEPQPAATDQPAPDVTTLPAPAPGGTNPDGTEPAPGGTIEPDPAPEKTIAPEPEPEPAPDQDESVLVEMHFDVTASGTTASLDYSNGIVCALVEGGPAKGAPERDSLAAALFAKAGSRSSGGAAIPVALAALLSGGAVLTRRALVR